MTARRVTPLIVLVCMSYSIVAHAQNEGHAIFLELGGNGHGGSLNYDYRFSTFSVRAGYGITPGHSSVTDYPFLLFNLLPTLSGSHHLELGAGPILRNSSQNGTDLGATSALGYRFQQADGGIQVRLTVTAETLGGEFKFGRPGLSVGYSF